VEAVPLRMVDVQIFCINAEGNLESRQGRRIPLGVFNSVTQKAPGIRSPLGFSLLSPHPLIRIMFLR
jgi:hypothetical protein